MFCVLWGTLLFDYETKEEAKSSVSPRTVTEILGVSEWDGKGRTNQYPYGFLLVTHTGGTYYSSVPTIEERDEWVLQVKRGLECVFANVEVAPFKPSKILQNRPTPVLNPVCPRSHQVLGTGAMLCNSCGRGFSSSEYIQEKSTILQIGSEEQEKVCSDCKLAQICIYWMKSLSYTHVMALHELTDCVLLDVARFKASFKLRRRLSERLDMAGSLLEDKKITETEFEELRQVDHAYRRQLRYEESLKLKTAVEAFGSDMQTLITLMMNPLLTKAGGRLSYYYLILRLLSLADEQPDLVDFYFPQLFQVYMQESLNRTENSMMRVDLLQQALLVLSQKYSPLSLKLAWNLLAAISDYHEKKAAQSQYASCVCLLLQLEMVVTGIVSSLADKPICKLLKGVFIGASHQLQEMGFDISALFLLRRRLQEMYDEEERQRQIRQAQTTAKLDGISVEQVVNAMAGKSSNPSFAISFYGVIASTDSTKKLKYKHSKEKTCLDLLQQLGVGQAHTDEEDDVSAASSTSHSPAKPNDTGVSDSITAQDDSALQKSSSKHKDRRQTYDWNGFAEQLDFMEKMTEVVESLRFMDRPLRTDQLRKEVDKWNDDPNLLGWDPTTIAGEPHYRITKIFSEECRVFRTKARAPTLIVCEVLREDVAAMGFMYYDSLQIKQGDAVEEVQSHFDHDDDAVIRGSIRESFDLSANIASTVVQGSNPLVVKMVPSSHQVFRDADHAYHDKLSIIDADQLPNAEDIYEANLHQRSCSKMDEDAINAVLKSDFENSLVQLEARMADMKVQQQLDEKNNADANGKSEVNKSSSSGNLSDTSASTNSSTNGIKANVPVILKKKSPSYLSANRLATGKTNEEWSSILPSPNSSKISAALNAFNQSNKVISSPNLEATPSNGTSDSTDQTPTQSNIPSSKVLSSAKKLLDAGKIDVKEYEMLIQCDQQFREEAAREEENIARTKVENAFGEIWENKKSRLLTNRIDEINSPDEAPEFWPIWDLRCFIVKSNDDLRQEVCCIQLMQLFKEVFEHFDLGSLLWLKPYRILNTGNTTGIVQVLHDAISLDALKKTEGFTTLKNYYETTYNTSPERLALAKKNFAASLAAYSLFSYILQIKDRHNGNLLIDTEGHIIHIDFGFLLSIAPGGSFSLETAPFKLTDEMMELMGGLDSPIFGRFVHAFTKGFIALQANSENIVNALQVLSTNSTYPCFTGKPASVIIDKLRSRFRTELSVTDAVHHCLDLVSSSYANYGTKQYDVFQWYSNGIAI